MRSAVREQRRIRAVLLALGLTPSGANDAGVKRQVQRLGLDTAHWTGQAHRRGTTKPVTAARPRQEVLVASSRYACTSQSKRRPTRAGLLGDRRAVCGFDGGWCGRPSTLVLDHVDGVNDGDRLENLRLLCPNCNSQLPTFAGRNKGSGVR